MQIKMDIKQKERDAIITIYIRDNFVDYFSKLL